MIQINRKTTKATGRKLLKCLMEEIRETFATLQIYQDVKLSLSVVKISYMLRLKLACTISYNL